MHSQKTDHSTITKEKQLVKDLAGLSDSDHIELNDVGWTSRVYIINNGQFVIKFPRSEVVKKEYEQEIKILRLLEQIHSEVQVPKLRWTHPGNEYMGYEGIVGQAFDQVAKNTDIEIKKNIGRAIGTFLKHLHNLPFKGTRILNIEAEIKEFQYKYGLAQSVITRDFSEQEQAKLKHLIEMEMPNTLRKLGEDMAVCHGDLGYWNMVLKADGSIGVIDFGDIGHYDRSKDFIGFEDSEALDEALQVYGDSELLRQKIAIRQKVLAILDLPFFIGKEDEDGIRRTVGKIRAGLSK